MKLAYYYVQCPGTEEWEKRFNPHATGNLHPPSYITSLPLHSYTGETWTSTASILKYLYTQPQYREDLLQITAEVCGVGCRVVELTHPNLKNPLYLSPYDTDKNFLSKIERYMELEGKAQWIV